MQVQGSPPAIRSLLTPVSTRTLRLAQVGVGVVLVQRAVALGAAVVLDRVQARLLHRKGFEQLSKS